MKIQNVQINALDFASQGNAILGIRDSGKSYTATWLAEQLLNEGIPFVAFDPIGVWRYLKMGKGKNKGYPVVVAGDVGRF
jgi:DNA helicase HerA-like ATPase